MADDRPWQSAAKEARNHRHRISCGPTGPDRDELAAEYRRVHNLAGVPPGSIVGAKRGKKRMPQPQRFISRKLT